jgi:hypothetical protein
VGLTAQEKIPDLNRLALPRPPNLESKYRTECLACQVKSQNIAEIFCRMPISSGAVTDRPCSVFLLSMDHLCVLNFSLSVTYENFPSRSRFHVFIFGCARTHCAVVFFHTFFFVSDREFELFGIGVFIHRGKNSRPGRAERRKSFGAFVSRCSTRSRRSCRAQETRHHHDRRSPRGVFWHTRTRTRSRRGSRNALPLDSDWLFRESQLCAASAILFAIESISKRKGLCALPLRTRSHRSFHRCLPHSF